MDNTEQKDHPVYRKISLRIALAIAIMAILFALVSWVWMVNFVQGRVGGIYWLLYLMNAAVFPLVMGSAIVVVVYFLIGLIASVWRRYICFSDLLKFTAIIFVAPICLVASIPPLMVSSRQHLDQQNPPNQVYYLADGVTLDGDIFFDLYQCDGFGFWCRRIYSSDAFIAYDREDRAELILDRESNSISIVVDGSSIFTTDISRQ